MSYCKCNPKATINGEMCLKCWCYCTICNSYPKPIYPGHTRYICLDCEDPTITIKGYRNLTKNIGILKCEIDSSITCGYTKNPPGSYKSMRPENKYYSIKDAIKLAETLFVNDIKRLKKLEKFKATWIKDIESKKSNSNKKEKIIENIKLIQKFEHQVDFNDIAVKDIIDKRLNQGNLDDPQIIHALTCDLENYSYYVVRKASLDKLINDHIPEKYRSFVKTEKYNEYLNKFYKNDDQLTTIFLELTQMYEQKLAQDNRQKELTGFINSITMNELITTKLLELEKCKLIFDDYVLSNKGDFSDSCQAIHDIAKPIIDKCNQALILKQELLDNDIIITIDLRKGRYLK